VGAGAGAGAAVRGGAGVFAAGGVFVILIVTDDSAGGGLVIGLLALALAEESFWHPADSSPAISTTPADAFITFIFKSPSAALLVVPNSK
jgi:hypothetical protein